MASTTGSRPAKQIVFYVMAATVTGAVLFLSGVRVGQGAVRRQVCPGEPSVVAAAGTAVAQPLEEPRPAVLSLVSGEPSAAASAADDLTYHGRLERDDAIPEALPDFEEPEPAPVAVEPPPAPAARPVPPSVGSAYTVQVAALQAPDAAEQVVGRLIAKGFPAYVRAPRPDDAVALYRVRVGRYTVYGQAEQIRLRLEREEHFKPWITR